MAKLARTLQRLVSLLAGLVTCGLALALACVAVLALLDGEIGAALGGLPVVAFVGLVGAGWVAIGLGFPREETPSTWLPGAQLEPMAPEPLPPALDECVWEVVSYAWTEIGIDQAECDRLVRRFGLGPANVDAARRICFRDAAASFGFETFLVFPLFLWMLMPDWGYGETYLRRRILNWRKRPLIWHFANPLRVLAYPLALLLALPQWRMLRKSLLANITPKDGQNGAT